MDLAELGLSVRSDGVVVASNRLDKLDKSAGRAEKSADRFSKSAEQMGRVLARVAVAGAAAMAALSAKSLKLAIDAEETASKFQVVFRGSVEATNNELIKLTKTIPLTLTEMRDLASGIQDLLVPLGIARTDAAGMSVEFVKLAGDIASFNNVKPDEALNAIKSALAGSSETMRRFGVDVSQTRLQAIAFEEGLIGVGEELNTAARAQALLIATTRDSSDALGDAARTAGSTANMIKFMQRDIKQASEDLGQALLPSLNEVLTAMNKVGDDGITPLQAALRGLGKTVMTVVLGLIIIKETALLVGEVLVGLGANVAHALMAIAAPFTETIKTMTEASRLLSEGEFSRAADAFEGMGQRIADSFKANSKAASDALGFIGESIETRVSGAMETVNFLMNQFSGEVNRAIDESVDFADSSNDLATALNEVAVTAEKMAVPLNKVAKTNNFDELARALSAELKALEGGEDAWREYTKAMYISNQVAKLGADATDEQIAKIVALASKLFEARSAAAELNDSIDDGSGAMRRLGAHMQAFGAIAGGALQDIQQSVGRGTEEYKKLEVAISAANVVAAIGAVLNQAQGEPYTAFARMAAMIAAVAALGQSIGSLGGGFTDTAAQRQDSQGTGTVLGDAEAKSESISKAIDITADATSELVGINRGMLNALETLNAAISGATGALARGGADSEYSALPQVFEKNAIFDPLGLFGGSAKVTDEGVAILAGSIGELIDGTLFRAYQEVQSKKYIWSSKKTREEMAGVSDEAAAQFGLIFQSLADTVSEGARILGVSQEVIDERLAAFRVAEQRISLKDLNAEEQAAEIQAVISSIFDDLAGAVVPYIEQFQKVGEGLGETLARVATSVQVMQEAVKQLGFAADASDPEIFAQMAVGLVELTGGVSEFISQFTNFVSKFATDEHKLAIATDALNRGFAQVGLTVPATAEGFWDLMQSLDASTDEGRKQIAMLLELTDFAADYYDMMDEAERTRLNALNAEIDAMVEIQTIAEGVVDKLTGLREMIVGDLSSPEENYERLRAEAEELAQSLQTMTDPAQIEATVARIEALTRQAYALLDDEQKQAMGQEFLDFIDAVQALALERLNLAADNLIGSSEFSPQELLSGFQERVADPLIYVSQLLTDASMLLNAAAGNFYIANGGEGPVGGQTPPEQIGPLPPPDNGIQSAVEEGMRQGAEAITQAAAAIIQSSSMSGASAQEVAAAVRSLPGRIELKIEQSEFS